MFGLRYHIPSCHLEGRSCTFSDSGSPLAASISWLQTCTFWVDQLQFPTIFKGQSPCCCQTLNRFSSLQPSAVISGGNAGRPPRPHSNTCYSWNIWQWGLILKDYSHFYQLIHIYKYDLIKNKSLVIEMPLTDFVLVPRNVYLMSHKYTECKHCSRPKNPGAYTG